jgi:hypothetical protein
VLGHRTDEGFTSTRDHYIDVLVQSKKMVDSLVLSLKEWLNHVGGEPASSQGFLEKLGQNAIGVVGFGPAT